LILAFSLPCKNLHRSDIKDARSCTGTNNTDGFPDLSLTQFDAMVFWRASFVEGFGGKYK
jgi:hypothetical protein